MKKMVECRRKGLVEKKSKKRKNETGRIKEKEAISKEMKEGKLKKLIKPGKRERNRIRLKEIEKKNFKKGKRRKKQRKVLK